MTTKEMKLAILNSVKLHEELFNREACSLHIEDMDRKYGKYSMALGNLNYFYHLSLEECIEKTLRVMKQDLGFTPLIHLALDGWWNDTLDWAREVTS